eukprot:Phypoly_transcript_01226.p1 GENE.Phypoly_transcript_01226~~Phypoly_transcript_01226.p1  ORF type:complete len:1171 (+),score=110.04 Phypoly_transcript_01226:319-3513(+)
MAMNSGNLSYAPINIANKSSPFAKLPANQWLQVFYNFSTTGYPFEKAYGWWIQDQSGQKNNAMVVIDDIYLVPIVRGDQFVTAIDAHGCVAQIEYAIGVAPAMNVTVTTFSPPCHGGYGTLQAVVMNGFAPFTYQWLPTYNPHQTINTKATSNYDVELIFRNTLESNFTDLSNPAVVSYDSEVVFRGNDSVKYTPAGTGVILWYRESGINISQYLGVQFWVYSESNVSSSLTFALATYDITQGATTNFVPFDFKILMGVQTIPANRWLKAFYNFSVLPNDTFFNAIWIRAATDSVGPVYLDEIKLILATNTHFDLMRVESYSLIVTDMNSCTSRLDGITLSEPEALEVDAQASLVSCSGGRDGNLTANPQGGTLPYSYNWTLFGANLSYSTVLSRTVKGLGQVSGYVQITDANGCSAISPTIAVGQAPAITYSYESQPISCLGDQDGQISLTAAGGIPPYSLSFPSSAFAANYIRVLPAYIYADDVIAPFNVTLPSDGNLRDSNFTAHSGYYSLSVENFEVVTFHCDTCFSASEYTGISFWVFVPLPEDTDSVMLTVVCGLAQWSGNSGIPPHATVLNATGKWMQVSYEMELNSTISWDSFYILASTPHNPQWIYFDTIQLIPRWFSNEPRTSGLPSGFDAIFVGGAGSQSIEIVDSNGCTKPVQLKIIAPTHLQLELVESDPPTLTTNKDGYIRVLATGGTPPYEYIWEQPGGFEGNATGLGEGVYNVTVRDSKGCQNNLSITLSTATVLVVQNVTVTVTLSLIVGLCIIGDLIALAVLTSKPAYYYEKSPLFCKIIHIGVLAGYGAAAIQIARPTNALCLIFPWLIGASFTLVYGCLFLKTWRIFCIIRMSKKMQKVSLTNLYICKLLSIYSAFELVFLIAWTVIDPPKVHLQNAVNDQKILQCNSKHYKLFWSVFLGCKFLWVVFGVVMAIGSRNMVAKFNESKAIYYCIYNTVIFAIICIPLQGVLANIPNAQVVIVVALIVIIYTFTLVALYFNIWMKILAGDDEFTASNLRHRGPLSETDLPKLTLPIGTFRSSIQSVPETSSTLHTTREFTPRNESN